MARVVLPDPGGPQRIMEGRRSVTMAWRRTFPCPRRCSCPTNSSRVQGLIRSARGASLPGRPVSFISKRSGCLFTSQFPTVNVQCSLPIAHYSSFLVHRFAVMFRFPFIILHFSLLTSHFSFLTSAVTFLITSSICSWIRPLEASVSFA